MHDMNKMQNKRQKPNHKGNNISHLRKSKELELRIWKVVSGALHMAEWAVDLEAAKAAQEDQKRQKAVKKRESHCRKKEEATRCDEESLVEK